MLQLGEVVEARLLPDGRWPKDTDAKKLKDATTMLYYETKSSHFHVFVSDVDLNGKLSFPQFLLFICWCYCLKSAV